jgi:MHS family shikimate/dehydroshikimate transporter-like MFS transporter
VFGSLSGIFGRRPVMIIGAIYTALYALVYFQILGTGTPWIAVLAMTAGHALGARSMFGVQPSFYCDLFPPEVRYSAIAFAREVTGAVVLGPLPLVATALLAQYNGSVWPIAALTAGMSLITLVSVALAPKERGVQ